MDETFRRVDEFFRAANRRFAGQKLLETVEKIIGRRPDSLCDYQEAVDDVYIDWLLCKISSDEAFARLAPLRGRYRLERPLLMDEDANSIDALISSALDTVQRQALRERDRNNDNWAHSALSIFDPAK